MMSAISIPSGPPIMYPIAMNSAVNAASNMPERI